MGKGSECAEDCSDKKQTEGIGGYQKEGRSGAEGEMGKVKSCEKECLIMRVDPRWALN